MHIVRSISGFTGRWFALIALAAGAIALAVPEPFAGGGPAVPWLLAVIMFGMGMTLRFGDFVVVAKRPWAALLGIAAQYVVMPLLALGISVALGLSAELTVGMILVGAAPGGTASNVMVYLAKGDTALSVAMTAVSTLLAPLLTPLLVLSLAGRFLEVDAADLFLSIVQIVVAPVLLGLLLRLAVPRVIERILDGLALVSVAGITAVIMIVVAASADTIMAVGMFVVLAVVAHNLLGLGLGYGVARACRIDVPGRRAVSIEVGMQNSGLSAALATAHFNPAAALPAAMFSVWHNISGALLAGYWARRPAAEHKDAAPDREPGART